MNKLFLGCSSLLSLDLTNFKTSKATSMHNMFYGCSSLKSLDLSTFDTSNVINMGNMFTGCSSLKSLDLSNFDVSKVQYIDNMFNGCSSLTSIDLSNFDVSNALNMNYMFLGCRSLLSLDLSNLDESKVTTMYNMFDGCTSLKSLDLSNFKTLNVENMGTMFRGCSSLVSIDLSSFDISKVKYIDNLFNGCNSLLSLDLSNFKTFIVERKNNMFDNCNTLKFINLKYYDGIDIFNTMPYIENLIICMDKFDELDPNSLKINGAINNCSSNICFQKPIIFNIEDKKCYFNCPKLAEDQFCNYEHTEILNIMPEGFFLNDTDEKTIDKFYYICKNCINYGDENNNNCSECISNYGFLEESKYKYNCYMNYEFYNFNNIINKYESSQQGFTLIIDSSNKTKNEIFNNIDDLMLNKETQKSYIIYGNGYSIFINPLDRKNDYSNSIIDFSKCEEILKIKYPDFEFRILQINIESTNPQCLNDQVEYRIYNQFGQEIELSCCENVNIAIKNKIRDNSLLNIDQIIYFKNKGIDILEINDAFFNDICYPYSDEKSNSDMILKDRVSDIYKNYSLCEKGCEYEYFDVENLYVKCNCKVKQNIINPAQEGNFKTYIQNSFLYSNFGIIKCYKLVFGIKGKLKNIGFWLYGAMILLHIPIYIIYCIQKLNPIKRYIDNEMNIHGYKVNNKQSINTIETSQYNLGEEEDIKNIPYNIKKKKSKFYKQKLNNCPPRKAMNNSFQLNNIKLENIIIEKEISSKDNFRNENDILSDFEKQKKQKKKNKKNKIKKIKKKKMNNSFTNNFTKHKTEKLFKIKSPTNSLNLIKKRKSSDEYENYEKSKDSQNNKIIKDNKKGFPLILINADNKGAYCPLESNYILNNYNYDEAIIYDNRTFCRIFFIYLISKDNLLNITFINPPLELRPLRICIFIFNLSCELALNALFYLSDNISDIYHYSGINKLFFSLINNLIISLISTITTIILLFFFQSLTKSSNKIQNLFRAQEKLLKENKEYKVNEETKLKIQNEIDKILKCLKIKILCFIIFEFLVMIFFYYYIISFCHVYNSTQISWLLDSLSSYIISFAISLSLSFIISIFYKLAIKNKMKFLYNLIILFY